MNPSNSTHLLLLPGTRKHGLGPLPSFVAPPPDESNLADIELKRAIKAVLSAKKVAVVVGAGISTAANIPDFRSSTGLFASLKSRFPNAKLNSGRDLFDINAWKDPETCSLHLGMLAELHGVCEKAQPTKFHEFLKNLDEEGKLSRVYTQNIDGLEEKAGLSYGIPDSAPPLRTRDAPLGSPKKRDLKRKRGQVFPSNLPPTPPITPPASICGDNGRESDDKDGQSNSLRAPSVSASSQSDVTGSEISASQTSTTSTLCTSESSSIKAPVGRVRTRSACAAEAVAAATLTATAQPRPIRAKPNDPFPRVIPLHGTLKHLTCSVCKNTELMSEYIPALSAGELIYCSQCETFDAARTISGFRPRGVGVLKSGVVLYGEEHKEGEMVGAVTSRDLMRGRRPDLLIVAGTSLKVPGTKRLVKELSKVIRPPSKQATDSEDEDEDKSTLASKKDKPIHTIFLNNEFPSPCGLWKDTFDVWVKGDLVKFIEMVNEERENQEKIKVRKAEEKLEREKRKEEKEKIKAAQQHPSGEPSSQQEAVKLPSTPRRKKASASQVKANANPSATSAKPKGDKNINAFFTVSKAGSKPNTSANISTKANHKPKGGSRKKADKPMVIIPEVQVST
ncbi:DHS-like NAD/FAD-binding domain-containing protein [Melampsora americana]|nr:DHS-like NAD/FAD-binding domain-containing protein [Melampsora americana]